MKDLVNSYEKKCKTIIGLLIAFIIGISTTVGATTIFNSKDITYSSSLTTKKNVKDSLDELYTKASKIGDCPENKSCLNFYDLVKVGDYIKMVPTSTSFSLNRGPMGYGGAPMPTSEINPSELNLWRVIKKNNDGTIDVVSEYVSNEKVYFKGKTGYIYLIEYLNTIAAQYTNTKYVQSTKHIGYSNQTSCKLFDECMDDEGYLVDTDLVKNVLGTLVASTPSGQVTDYFLASRYGPRYGDGTLFAARRINTDGNLFGVSMGSGATYLYWSTAEREGTIGSSVRPMLTLKAGIQIQGGDGESGSSAWILR